MNMNGQAAVATVVTLILIALFYYEPVFIYVFLLFLFVAMLFIFFRLIIPMIGRR